MRQLWKRLMLVRFLPLISCYLPRIYRQFQRFDNVPETLVTRYVTFLTGHPVGWRIFERNYSGSGLGR